MIFLVVIAVLYSGLAGAVHGNVTKVTSQGGYSHLVSKSQDSGTVKIIVRVKAPFTPEPSMHAQDLHEQRALTMGIQEQVLEELRAKGHRPGPVYAYKYTPYMAMTVDTETLASLLSSPYTVSIEEDIFLYPMLDWSVPRIGATQLHTNNVKGTGMTVAIIDSGVDKTHPFLNGSVLSEACYSTTDRNDMTTSLCPGGVEESTAPGSAMPCGGTYSSEDCGHGTHVAGIVAGRSGVSMSPGPGVAPEANLIAIQVFSRYGSYISAYISDVMKGLERVYELRNTYTIASVNMSLGGGQYYENCDTFPLKEAIDNLRTAGIATIVASGNNYFCGSMAAPACISTAISVGATESDDSDSIAYYSNSASFLNLLAPGSSINSSVPGGYGIKDGTSMATPHVAGAWALMKQANPTATVDDILDSLTLTGRQVTDSYCTSVTKKRINVFEANVFMSTNASLTIAKTGVGTGTVASSPIGIDCGGDCRQFFLKDTQVTLSASADPGTEFGGWNGGGCSGTDPSCSVTLSETFTMNALFLKEITIGSKITINGAKFGTKKGKVLIGDVAAKIAKDGWTDNTITAFVSKVPAGSPGIFSITIVPKGANSIFVEQACTVKAPLIDSLSENHGSPNAAIRVNGRHFGSGKPKIYLEYTDKKGLTKKKTCKVNSWAMETTTEISNLEFVVPKLPDGFVPGSVILKISNKVGAATIPFTVDSL